MLALLAAGAINPIPDPMRVVYSLGVFLFVFIVLSKFVINPILAILAKRHSLTEGASDEAESLNAEAERAEMEVKNRLDAERRAIAEAEEAKRRVIDSETRKEVEVARDLARKEITASRVQLEKELAKVRGELEAEVPVMVETIIKTVTNGDQKGVAS